MCCKQIRESFMGKGLEMASSPWVVWSSGVTFPAAGEVTQPESLWLAPDIRPAWPGCIPVSGLRGSVFWVGWSGPGWGGGLG